MFIKFGQPTVSKYDTFVQREKIPTNPDKTSSLASSLLT